MSDGTALQSARVTFRRMRAGGKTAGYEGLLLPVAGILFAPTAWPAWLRMWLIALAMYSAFKWLTWRQTTVRDAPVWKSLAYLLAWPGMDADAFLGTTSRKQVVWPDTAQWLLALGNCGLGLVLILNAGRLVPGNQSYARGWIGMLGIVLMLHFGLFQVLSCAWRRIGLSARPLMRWPLAATSLSDFWGQRWNTAFRDLSHRLLFQPIAARWGASTALLAVFVVSGLVHELAISFPVDAGWGGPTCYFTAQGCGLLLEHSLWGKRAGLGTGLRGRLFAATVLIAPLPLLFHAPFVTGVIDPLVQSIGNLL